MSTRFEIDPPELLPGRLISVPNRGEFFVRHSTHADPTAPVVLLLHGWTASSDLNFFTAYRELSGMASVISIDHRGHGRGVRPDVSFTLEDCADDAAAVCEALGVSSVVTCAVSYRSSGWPTDSSARSTKHHSFRILPAHHPSTSVATPSWMDDVRMAPQRSLAHGTGRESNRSVRCQTVGGNIVNPGMRRTHHPRSIGCSSKATRTCRSYPRNRPTG